MKTVVVFSKYLNGKGNYPLDTSKLPTQSTTKYNTNFKID